MECYEEITLKLKSQNSSNPFNLLSDVNGYQVLSPVHATFCYLQLMDFHLQKTNFGRLAGLSRLEATKTKNKTGLKSRKKGRKLHTENTLVTYIEITYSENTLFSLKVRNPIIYQK